MVNVARRYGEVHLFVVHGILEPEVVENDMEVQVDYLCEGPLENEDNSHINGAPQVDKQDKLKDEVGAYVSENESEGESWIDSKLESLNGSEGTTDKEEKAVDYATRYIEGLVDVHVNVEYGVQNIVEGSVKVGMGLSEHSIEEDNGNIVLNRKDKGLLIIIDTYKTWLLVKTIIVTQQGMR
ncbi:hypothetical protein LR48_Vigan252s005200 [Vigna angularis]|uniref:Uncharacterized protein n=1 Tax=Phaseolus angularis TaxID=3914 RepID=A0A0L9T6W0_PHAAN|nr:hypothetical protein LR48_Vigan252s005200 [Vigna angularis]